MSTIRLSVNREDMIIGYEYVFEHVSHYNSRITTIKGIYNNVFPDQNYIGILTLSNYHLKDIPLPRQPTMPINTYHYSIYQTHPILSKELQLDIQKWAPMIMLRPEIKMHPFVWADARMVIERECIDISRFAMIV